MALLALLALPRLMLVLVATPASAGLVTKRAEHRFALGGRASRWGYANGVAARTAHAGRGVGCDRQMVSRVPRLHLLPS